MSALKRDIGVVPNTPLAIALKETMDYLPKLSHTDDKCDYTTQLDAIEQAVDLGYAEGEHLTLALSNYT